MVQEKFKAGTDEYYQGELNRPRKSELRKEVKKAIEKFPEVLKLYLPTN